MAVLKLEDIRKSYTDGDKTLSVLRGVSLSIDAGESVALLGQSGSGKTTLIQIAALLDSPTSGRIEINDRPVQTLSDSQKTEIRRNTIGFVYQFHHLLPEFTALENVTLPQLVAGVPLAIAKQRSKDLLGQVSMSHRLEHYPKKLSGGEQQRVAIARALANNPKLLIADEPTGNLDNRIAGEVFELMLKLLDENKMAALIATHNTDLAKLLSRSFSLND